MNSQLSIDLPASINDLIAQPAFDQFTLAGPNLSFESRLNLLTVGELFSNPISDPEMARCCLSGLWLLHNFLDQSHEISQDIHSAEGSYWHGIMHRMEGDFGNSKYWYRKVGNHPVYSSISGNGSWDPEEFVDQCEAAKRSGGAMAKTVQQTAVAEWKALFEYCFNHATQ